MKPKLNVLVSCTASKNLPAAMQFDDYVTDNDDVLCTDWLDKAGKIADKMPAIDLYKGPGADKFREIRAFLSEKYDVTLWILSAGFGLVREDTLLPGYDATFSSMAKHNRVKPKQYWDWLNGVSDSSALLVDKFLILLPSSYLKPFRVLDDPSNHIVLGPYGALERDIIGCSMIRVQLEYSYEVIKYGLTHDIDPEDWPSITWGQFGPNSYVRFDVI